MSPDQWEQVKSAFEAARDLPAAEKSAFLAEMLARDASLLSLVKDLLREHEWLTSDDNPSRKRAVFTKNQLVAGRFRIIRLIAEGGMGQVYEAFDEFLQLRIALKTLHPGIVRDTERLARFRREIRVALEVAHENLCRVHDLIEHVESNGTSVPCLTMELLEGETLQSHVAARRPLSIDLALSLIRQVADALTTLHNHGIIHRDMKPSNIIITQRKTGSIRAVVTDFGLAKPIESDLGLFETKLEQAAGAPFFMAPELFSGSRPSIASDIYAFGMVIDEMVTATPAFDLGSFASLYYSKLQEGPIAPSRRSQNLPSSWENVILRCLNHKPELRYASVAQIVRDLENHSERSATPFAVPVSSFEAGAEDRKSAMPTVAVMPFEDLSPSKDQGYFCDGLTEEVIHLLSQIKGLRVMARTSVFALRKSGHDALDVGRRLGVSNILEGSIQRRGDDVRLITRFVDTAGGFNVFSKRYDRKLTDVFAIQDEVASSIVATLRIEMLGRPASVNGGPGDMAFYNCYLRGLHEFHKQTIPALWIAVRNFEESIALNGNFASAHTALADCYIALAWYEAIPPSEALPKAERSALAALGLDPDLAPAHCALGQVKARFHWDWTSAEEEFRSALFLNSGLSRLHFCYALDFLTPLGRLEEALSELQRAQQIDPLSLIVQTAIGGNFYRKRHYQKAKDLLMATTELDPGFYHAHWSLARCLEQLRQYEDAVRAYQTALSLTENNCMILAELGHCFGSLGDAANAEVIYRELGTLSDRQYVTPLCFSFVHLGRGELHKALDCLQHAIQERSSMLIWLGIDPRWDVLRREPAFLEIVKQVGLPAASTN